MIENTNINSETSEMNDVSVLAVSADIANENNFETQGFQRITM